MKEDEIQTLLDDDEFFESAFLNFDGVREHGENFAKVMKNLQNQAQENMKLKEKVDSEVVQHEIKYAEFEQAQAEFDKLKEKIMGFW